jgi:integrase
MPNSCIRCNRSNRLPRRFRSSARCRACGAGRLALELPGGIRTVGTPPVTSFAAGVDVRTVAGRLGHSGGGTTTLRTYAAWVSEADQRAASGIATRMPSRPMPLGAIERAQHDPQSPYEKIAAELRCRILSGHLVEGDFAPTEKQLAAEHQVAIGTAHRAMELLKTWGFITSSRSRRAIVVRPPEPLATPSAEHPGDSDVLQNAVHEQSASALQR